MLLTLCGALPLHVGGTHDLPLTHRWDAAPMIMLCSTKLHLPADLPPWKKRAALKRMAVGEAPMQDSMGSLQELRVAFSKKLKPSVL